MAVTAPVCDFGLKPPGFELTDTDGRLWRLQDVAGPRGTLIMFICNHCPYVLAVLDRIIRDARDLKSIGIGVAAISSNDPAIEPQDSYPEMQRLAQAQALPFPYLFDETQAVGRAFGAACTPDFFGYNARFELQYRGRLDASGRQPAPPGARRELFEAMTKVALTGAGPQEQVSSMGCSIKWRGAAAG